MSDVVDSTGDRGRYRAYVMAADRMDTADPGIPTTLKPHRHSSHRPVVSEFHGRRGVLPADGPDGASYTDVISDHHAVLAVAWTAAGLSTAQHSQRKHAD